MKLLISVLLIIASGAAIACEGTEEYTGTDYVYDAPTTSSDEIRDNYIRETGRIPCVVCDGSVDENGDNF